MDKPKLTANTLTDAALEDRQIIANSLLFDGDWYCKTYGFGKYLDAANHYLQIGWREDKNPSPFFKTADYLKKNQGKSLPR